MKRSVRTFVIILSVLAALTVLAIFSFAILRNVALNLAEKAIKNSEFSYSSFEKHPYRKLVVNDFVFSLEGKEAVTVKKADFSFGIGDILRMVLSKKPVSANLELSGVAVYMDSLSGLETKQNKRVFSLPGSLNSFSVHISDAYIVSNEFSAVLQNIKATVTDDGAADFYMAKVSADVLGQSIGLKSLSGVFDFNNSTGALSAKANSKTSVTGMGNLNADFYLVYENNEIKARLNSLNNQDINADFTFAPQKKLLSGSIVLNDFALSSVLENSSFNELLSGELSLTYAAENKQVSVLFDVSAFSANFTGNACASLSENASVWGSADFVYKDKTYAGTFGYDVKESLFSLCVDSFKLQGKINSFENLETEGSFSFENTSIFFNTNKQNEDFTVQIRDVGYVKFAKGRTEGLLDFNDFALYEKLIANGRLYFLLGGRNVVETNELRLNYETVGYLLLSGKISDKRAVFPTVRAELFSRVFNGSLDVSYSSVSNLLSKDFKSLEGYASVLGNDGELRCSVKDSSFGILFDSALYDLNLLGSFDRGFWVDCNFNTVTFSGSYENGMFCITDFAGFIGSAALNNLEFTVDVSSGVALLQSSLVFEGNKISDINLSADLKEDGPLKASLHLSDFDLYDCVKIEDTVIDLTYQNRFLALKGDVVNGFFDLDLKTFNLSLDKKCGLGFVANGGYENEFYADFEKVYLPSKLLNPVMNCNDVAFTGGLLTGSVSLRGPVRDMLYYGFVKCSSLEMSTFYTPDQVLTAKDVSMSLTGHEALIPATPVSSYNVKTGQEMKGTYVGVTGYFESSSLESLVIDLDLSNSYITLWCPMSGDGIDIYGNVGYGNAQITVYPANSNKPTDIKVDGTCFDFFVDFDLPPLPDWYGKYPSNIEMRAKTGQNVKLAYPNEESALFLITASEGQSMYIKSSVGEGITDVDGKIEIKAGRISYFNNDFIITDGSLDLAGNPFVNGRKFEPSVDLNAKIREFDLSGRPVDIYMSVNGASFTNLNPIFSSSPSLPESEILQILGQYITVFTSDGFSSSSVANVADAVRSVYRVINPQGISQSRNSMFRYLKDAFGFDIFSVRTSLLSNILIETLNSGFASDSSSALLARYLNGTTFFIGKYIYEDVFARASMQFLSYDGSHNSDGLYGRFFSNDLLLNTELSLSYDFPMGTCSVFTEPRELSIPEFLDTMGLSFILRFKI